MSKRIRFRLATPDAARRICRALEDAGVPESTPDHMAEYTWDKWMSRFPNSRTVCIGKDGFTIEAGNESYELDFSVTDTGCLPKEISVGGATYVRVDK